MRHLSRLVMTIAALLPGVAVAQSIDGQFRSPPSPPPLPHSPQNPSGGSSPTAPTSPFNPTTSTTPTKLAPAPRRPKPGGNALTGLVGYLDSEMQAGPQDIDVPVTGYGNEALWDDGQVVEMVPQGDFGD